MLRFSRNFILFLPVILLVFIVTGFLKHEKVEAERDFCGQKINSPVEIYSVLENPIEISRIERGEGPNQNWSYIEISGLFDTSVEKSINEKILSLFHQMLLYATGEKLPPYRGIVPAVKGRELSFSHISFEPYFNYNNVLSVVASVEGAYGPHYFSLMEPLNFDLTTGQSFFIEDVFTDDVHGLAVVNTAILHEVARRRYAADYMYTDLRLVAPFQGISGDQKFFLGLDRVGVIIDYNNPAFDVGFRSAIVEVPFFSTDGSIAITQRFMDRDGPIYKEGTRQQLLIRKTQWSTVVHTHFSYNLEEIYWSITMNYPEDLPPIFMESIYTLQRDLEERTILQSKEVPISYVEKHFEVYSIGPFVNVLVYIYYDSVDNLHFKEVGYVYKKTGERIQLEDLFVEGFAYEQLIRGYFEKEMMESGLASIVDEDSVNLLLEELFFKLLEKDLVVMTRPQQWDTEDRYQVYFAIPYIEMGYENLQIFNGF